MCIRDSGNQISIQGASASKVGALFEEMVLLLEQGHVIDATSLGRSIDMVLADEKPSDIFGTDILRVRGRTIRPKSSGQKKYIQAIADNVITFGIGPAGTGKSWLAVAMAVKALQQKQVRRIILTSPAV